MLILMIAVMNGCTMGVDAGNIPPSNQVPGMAQPVVSQFDNSSIELHALDLPVNSKINCSKISRENLPINPNTVPVGLVYQFYPQDNNGRMLPLNLSQPAMVHLSYADIELPAGVTQDDLYLFVYNANVGHWEMLESIRNDTVAKVLSGKAQYTGFFQIAALNGDKAFGKPLKGTRSYAYGNTDLVRYFQIDEFTLISSQGDGTLTLGPKNGQFPSPNLSVGSQLIMNTEIRMVDAIYSQNSSQMVVHTVSVTHQRAQLFNDTNYNILNITADGVIEYSPKNGVVPNVNLGDQIVHNTNQLREIVAYRYNSASITVYTTDGKLFKLFPNHSRLTLDSGNKTATLIYTNEAAVNRGGQPEVVTEVCGFGADSVVPGTRAINYSAGSTNKIVDWHPDFGPYTLFDSTLTKDYGNFKITGSANMYVTGHADIVLDFIATMSFNADGGIRWAEAYFLGIKYFYPQIWTSTSIGLKSYFQGYAQANLSAELNCEGSIIGHVDSPLIFDFPLGTFNVFGVDVTPRIKTKMALDASINGNCRLKSGIYANLGTPDNQNKLGVAYDNGWSGINEIKPLNYGFIGGKVLDVSSAVNVSVSVTPALVNSLSFDIGYNVPLIGFAGVSPYVTFSPDLRIRVNNNSYTVATGFTSRVGASANVFGNSLGDYSAKVVDLEYPIVTGGSPTIISGNPTTDTRKYFTDLPFNGNANDVSGSGNNATVNKAVLTTDRFGKANSAYYLNGNATITVPKPKNSVFTYSFWFRDDSTGAQFRRWLTTTTGGFSPSTICLREINSSGAQLYAGDNVLLTSSPFWKDKNWHLYTIVSDGSKVKFFYDGVLKGWIFRSIVPEGDYLYFGGNYNNASEWSLGAFDDIKIMNTALQDNEVQDLYTVSKPSVAVIPTQALSVYIPFSGTMADVSGYKCVVSNYGTVLTNNRFGTPNSAVFFNGNAYIGLVRPSTPAYTYNFWMRDDTKSSGFRRWITTTTTGFAANSLCLRETDAGMIQLFAGGSTLYNKGAVKDGNWHMYTIASDASNTWLYQDGVLIYTVNKGFMPEGNTLYFGGKYGSGSEYVVGAMDDIRVYQRALNPSEINNLLIANQ